MIERELPRDTPAALEVTLHPRAGTTVYARYGNSFLYLVMTLAALLSLAVPISTARDGLRRSRAK
jgi:apolipoprotein N-acyltransferase